jgi:hypothetical protein
VDHGRGPRVACDGGPVDVEEVTRVELREVLLDVLRWWDTFLRSPGLGGLAAVGAAWVGFRQWRRQARLDVETRVERSRAERRARHDDQWWEVYRLVRASRSRSPESVSEQDQRLMRALLRRAETEMQYAAVGVLAATSGNGEHPRPQEEENVDDHR